MTQPTYPQPGYQQPPQPPQPKKTPLAVKIVVIVAILIWVGGCGAIIAAIGSADTTATTAQPTPAPTLPTPAATPSTPAASQAPKSQEPEPKASEPEMAGIGDKVRDGDYQFTVTKVRCGVSRVGDSYLNEKAQGQFCLVSMRVKNVGNDPINFSDENQTLVDTKGKNYSPDDEAWIYMDDSDPYAEINPGNTLKTTVPFDLPKSAKPDYLLLKAGTWGFSEGVKVKL